MHQWIDNITKREIFRHYVHPHGTTQNLLQSSSGLKQTNKPKSD